MSQDPDFICNNHIRVYQWLPSNPSQLLVCGTQAVTRPQCRILEVRERERGRERGREGGEREGGREVREREGGEGEGGRGREVGR